MTTGANFDKIATNTVGGSQWTLKAYDCDLCGSNIYKLLLQKRGRVTSREFNIVSCKRCAFVYVNPRISDDQIHALYNEAYYRGEGFDAAVRYDDAKLDAGARRGLEQIVATIVEAIGTSARLDGISCLDVGCGSGALVEALVKAGASALGQDSSVEALRLARLRGVNLTPESVQDLVASERQFDVITAIEVIEHVPHPTAFTISLAQLLRPGGLLLLGTGNWNVVRRIPGTPYLMPEGHLQYFTPATMSRLFDRAGLLQRSQALNGTWTGCRLASRFGVGFARSPLLRLASSLIRAFAPGFGPLPLALKPPETSAS